MCKNYNNWYSKCAARDCKVTALPLEWAMQQNASHYEIIIIGTGHAGYTLARQLRKTAGDSSVLMLTLDDGASYSKPMLSNGLAKKKSAADLASQSAEQMGVLLDVDIKPHCKVEAIETATRLLSTTQGDFHYQHLVLACGAQQINLPIAGEGTADVLTVNNLQDYEIFLQKLVGAKRVAVMGPGLIGCEFANDLASVNIQSILIGPDSSALERLVPPVASEALMRAMSELDTEWYLQCVVTEITSAPDGYQLSLSNGEQVQADLVLSAAGLKPDLSLAQAAGLDTKNGIVVDRYLRTSNEYIYALGDCAEVEGLVLPYIMPIMHGAKALAATLGGRATKVNYPAMPVVIKTPVHPVVVATIPEGVQGQWNTESTEGGIHAQFIDVENQIRGFVLTGKHVSAKGKLERNLPMLLA